MGRIVELFLISLLVSCLVGGAIFYEDPGQKCNLNQIIPRHLVSETLSYKRCSPWKW